MMYLPPPVNIRATAGKKKSMGSSIAQPPMGVREKLAALCAIATATSMLNEKSDDEEHGGYNFAHQCTIGEKFGHTHACKHTFDAGKSVCYLKDTVEEEHKTNAYSENEKSNVLIA